MRPHDIELIQRTMLSEVPLRFLFSELWRRVLAWVDAKTKR